MNSVAVGFGIIGLLMLVFIAMTLGNLDANIKELADYIQEKEKKHDNY